MKQQTEFKKAAKRKPALPPISILFSNIPLFYHVFFGGLKSSVLADFFPNIRQALALIFLVNTLGVKGLN